MNRQAWILSVSLGVLAWGACAPHPGWRVILIEVVEENGRLVEVVEPHDTAVVGPGDRITWKCKCPSGAEFRITEVTRVADLAAFYDEATELRGYHEELRERIEEGASPAASTEAPVEGSEPPAKEADGGADSGPGEADRTLLKLLDALFVAPDGEGLFDEPWPGSGWAKNKIVSPPVRDSRYSTYIFKFTAEVRLGDQTLRIDPHIYDHGDEAKK